MNRETETKTSKVKKWRVT